MMTDAARAIVNRALRSAFAARKTLGDGRYGQA
jgi:hypothetical protein